MVTFNINHDGTIEWRSNRVKEMLEDFDAKIDTRIINGKAGDHRTEAITVKPSESTNSIEIIGVNESIEIDHKNRKNCDVEFIEVRGAIDSNDEDILIANAIIIDRLIKSGFRVEEKAMFKKKWKAGTNGVGYGYQHYD